MSNNDYGRPHNVPLTMLLMRSMKPRWSTKHILSSWSYSPYGKQNENKYKSIHKHCLFVYL